MDASAANGPSKTGKESKVEEKDRRKKKGKKSLRDKGEGKDNRVKK